MVGIDPFLYVALAAGYVLGRARPIAAAWTGRATIATVVVLIALLGGNLAGNSFGDLLGAIPRAVLLALAILGFTYLLARALATRRPTIGRGGSERPWYPLGFLVALGGGFVLGARVPLPYSELIEISLYALLFLVGLGLEISWKGVHGLGRTLLAAFGGAIAAGLLFWAVGGADLRLALATTLAFGWYSLAGPVVATGLGPTAGLLAFLANYLREYLTMLSAPVLGPRGGPEAVTALGGATAMDTTLYFVTRFGDPDSGALALASGLILTLSAGVLVPLVVALPAA